MRAKIGLARTASGKESERPALLGRPPAEIHAKGAADQVRRAEQLCADCVRGARLDALAATRPTVCGDGAVYRLAHVRQNPTGAGVSRGAGAADCVDQPETVPETHPWRECPSHGPSFLNPGRAKERRADTCSNCQ